MFDIMQFPDLIDIFLSQLPINLAEFLELLRAIFSLLGVTGLIISIVCLLLSAKIKFKGLFTFMIFSLILCIICGFDTGLIYFKII
jgi:hypothetical protein